MNKVGFGEVFHRSKSLGVYKSGGLGVWGSWGLGVLGSGGLGVLGVLGGYGLWLVSKPFAGAINDAHDSCKDCN